MKSVKITHSFSIRFAILHDALHDMLSEDKNALPSWNPSGDRVYVVYDDRNKMDKLFSRAFYPKIVDISINREGVLTMECASSWWFDFSGARLKLIQKLITNLQTRLKEN